MKMDMDILAMPSNKGFVLKPDKEKEFIEKSKENCLTKEQLALCMGYYKIFNSESNNEKAIL